LGAVAGNMPRLAGRRCQRQRTVAVGQPATNVAAFGLARARRASRLARCVHDVGAETPEVGREIVDRPGRPPAGMDRAAVRAQRNEQLGGAAHPVHTKGMDGDREVDEGRQVVTPQTQFAQPASDADGRSPVEVQARVGAGGRVGTRHAAARVGAERGLQPDAGRNATAQVFDATQADEAVAVAIGAHGDIRRATGGAQAHPTHVERAQQADAGLALRNTAESADGADNCKFLVHGGPRERIGGAGKS